MYTGSLALVAAAASLLAMADRGLGISPPTINRASIPQIYVHVPGAILSLTVYTVRAAASAVALIWRHQGGACRCRRIALIGASFALLALVTGPCGAGRCGAPIGPWDPRLTSELILLFLYVRDVSCAPHSRIRRAIPLHCSRWSAW